MHTRAVSSISRIRFKSVEAAWGEHRHIDGGVLSTVLDGARSATRTGFEPCLVTVAFSPYFPVVSRTNYLEESDYLEESEGTQTRRKNVPSTRAKSRRFKARRRFGRDRAQRPWSSALRSRGSNDGDRV